MLGLSEIWGTFLNPTQAEEQTTAIISQLVANNRINVPHDVAIADSFFALKAIDLKYDAVQAELNISPQLKDSTSLEASIQKFQHIVAEHSDEIGRIMGIRRLEFDEDTVGLKIRVKQIWEAVLDAEAALIESATKAGVKVTHLSGDIEAPADNGTLAEENIGPWIDRARFLPCSRNGGRLEPAVGFTRKADGTWYKCCERHKTTRKMVTRGWEN